MTAFDYDVLVIGSGFGGSVTALRLTEKGYRVGVLESGRRFADRDFPQTSWHIKNYLFAPRLGCTGILRLSLLGNVLVLSGAGVGGGSLGYANTLYEPPAAFYEKSAWAVLTDWRRELAPYYAQARRMLGVTPNPIFTAADHLLKETARDLGCEDTFRAAPVGVHFGPADTKSDDTFPDPYFGGAGPTRNACINCGACMTGCRHNAKNTLPKNYLGLAERAGATVLERRTVTGVARSGEGWNVTSVRTGTALRRRRQTLRARHVVFAAGALGTQKLLHKLRHDGSLPNLSTRLGRLTRTNSEAVLGVRAKSRDADYTHGVAITSSIHLDSTTHVEPVRYGRGSNLLALLAALLVDPVPGRSRLLLGLAAMARNVRHLPALHTPRRWSQQSVVLLVMQSLDNSVTTYLRRTWTGRRRLTSRPGEGAPNPAWIPTGHRAARAAAARIGGQPCGTWGDLFNIPTTGHLIGGCTIGDSSRTGVVDPYHRLHNYPDLHVIDGSTISANLGVNPSLTITALAERATALWPNKDETDPRPQPGRPYRSVPPVPPHHPVVPDTAPGALRLPPPKEGL
ncbi:GMC family oxidoreductase [Streptomyces sp. 142MFCol3.1]|uniref:GMC family oxidoreductase n=1 Tax=Streptomyces sp. 142MFCol3.1 TaxID=1172179 RepID=UPI00040166B0|nr:GMC family oxidoreductase [Streptomyces sp. 142MFCol3.1]